MVRLPRPPNDSSGRRYSAETAPPARTVKLTSTRARVAKQKAEILSLFEQGHTAADACRLVGLSKESWKYYKSNDKDFADEVNLILARRSGAKATEENVGLSFGAFSEKYL